MFVMVLVIFVESILDLVVIVIFISCVLFIIVILIVLVKIFIVVCFFFLIICLGVSIIIFFCGKKGIKFFIDDLIWDNKFGFVFLGINLLFLCKLSVLIVFFIIWCEFNILYWVCM